MTGTRGLEPAARRGTGPIPHTATVPELIGHGWRLAEATLATAATEHTLVTHWFLTAEDDRANADEHFGSNARTLRFLGVALPTLIDQLGASRAVVAVPWDLDAPRPTLTVLALAPSAAPAWATRALVRLPAGSGPPFWRLAPDLLPAAPQLAAVVAGLAV